MTLAACFTLVVALTGPSAGQAAREPVQIELAIGESSRLGSSAHTVVFEKVESDSRCPTGVTCIWEGDAVVRLSLGTPRGERTEVALHTSPKSKQEVVHEGFVIRLESLVPHPRLDAPVQPDQYRARLRVTSPKGEAD